MNFYTADLHMNHRNSITLCSRPFIDLEHMHRELIARWNSRVTAADAVFVLGDFEWSKSHLKQHLNLLNGTKRLICGNHDDCHPCHKKHEKMKQFYLDAGFAEVHEELMITIDKYQVKLSHFPYWNPEATEHYEVRYKEWRPIKGKEAFCLHGHSHSSPDKKLKLNPPALDVGVDGNNYYPYSEEEITKIIYEARSR